MQWSFVKNLTPNLLTTTRVALIPVFVALSYLPGRWGLILSTAMFGVAAITDWADGYLARRDGMQTPFGRFFDPVADKLLVISALVLLVDHMRAPLFLVLLIIAREVTIMGLREYVCGLGEGGVPVSRLGKWKTGFQMTAIVMLMLQEGLFDIPFQYPGMACLYVSTFLTLWSGYQYLLRAWPCIRGCSNEARTGGAIVDQPGGNAVG